MNAPTTSLELLWAWSGPLALGALSTVGIAVFAYTIGILLGLAGAMGKLAGNDALKRVLEWYKTLVRFRFLNCCS